MMAINLDGAYLTARETLGGMLAEKWGRVIFVASIAGLRGLKGAPAYSASKHGMIGLMRGLSEEYMGSGITFNALCPGYVDTPIVERNTQSIADRAGIPPEQARQMTACPRPPVRVRGQIPLAGSHFVKISLPARVMRRS